MYKASFRHFLRSTIVPLERHLRKQVWHSFIFLDEHFVTEVGRATEIVDVS